MADAEDMGNTLLWVFTRLPDDYVVLDTETTGLPDEQGLPDIVTLGITVVRQRQITDAVEFRVRPRRPITREAQAIHGISNAEAASFERFDVQWPQMADHLRDQLIVIHNAGFDWPILLDHLARYGLSMPPIKGVFCSQTAAIPWARAMGMPLSTRGPSLDTLVAQLGVDDLRADNSGLHGAGIDSQLTAQVVEAMRRIGVAG